ADTGTFKVLESLDAGDKPFRIALQPNGRYLWIGNDSSDRKKSGVTVIDARDRRVVAQVLTGAGHHEIAFSSDSRYSFVTNRSEGTLSVIDAQRLEKVKDIKTGELPVALDFSSASNAVYVAAEGDGRITVVDGESHLVTGQINMRPGLKALRFAPGGRWGFAVNAKDNTVDVFDAANNQTAYSVGVGAAPDKVSFTHAYAYVHARGTAEVSLIALAQLGQPGTLPVIQITGGQNAPGESPSGSIADVVFPIYEHGGDVLIANPADKYIYYYMEGMKAPMGGFQNQARVPRAVRVVDRSIRETGPGVYTATVRIPKAGEYQVAFLLDSPRIAHCFGFTAKPSSLAVTKDDGATPKIEFLTEDREVQAGQEFKLRFRLIDPRRNEPISGVGDVQVVATLASGLWRERYRAASTGDGLYEADLTLPRPGPYYVFFAVPSLKIPLNQIPSLTLNARPAQ
ncbi:MAG TPA: YncE family protein, partial [Dehalococcoidia bacterium]|nr:YncE family protein [Dehalococcoidia bacterium]